MTNLTVNPRKIILLTAFIGVFVLLSSLTINRDHSIDDDPDCLEKLNIPKEFSPEADTLNRFSIDFPCPLETFAIQVYHPNGDRVYFSQDPKFSWDGNDPESKPCETQVYSWKLNYKYQMQNVILKGGLLLLR